MWKRAGEYGFELKGRGFPSLHSKLGVKTWTFVFIFLIGSCFLLYLGQWRGTFNRSS